MPLAAPSAQSLLERRSVVPRDLIWRLDVNQYHEMIATGIITEEDPVELLDGCLVPKMPKKPPHSLATTLIREALARLAPAGWFVDSQEPITLEDSEPEPDVRVVRGDRRHYLERHPGPREVGLVVEVSDATLERDRSLKHQIYAHAGIPVYWIANLRAGRLEVHTEPSGPAAEPGYGRRHELGPGDSVDLELGGKVVGRLAVADLLP